MLSQKCIKMPEILNFFLHYFTKNQIEKNTFLLFNQYVFALIIIRKIWIRVEEISKNSRPEVSRAPEECAKNFGYLIPVLKLYLAIFDNIFQPKKYVKKLEKSNFEVRSTHLWFLP